MKNKLESEDIKLLVEKTKGKTDAEKLKIVFDWFVNNWSYEGYGRFQYMLFDTASEQDSDNLVDDINFINALIVLDTKLKETNVDAFFAKHKTNSEFWKIDRCLSVLEWASSLSEKQIKDFEQTKPRLAKALTNVLANKQFFEDGCNQDIAEAALRKSFLKKEGKKYVGVCQNFAEEFERVCKQIDLQDCVVLTCNGLINNGICSAYHAFNAVVDDETEKVKYIDISYAIHAREQKQGFVAGDKFNSENPDEFFMKTRDQIEKAEGKERTYLKTEESLVQKARKENGYPF